MTTSTPRAAAPATTPDLVGYTDLVDAQKARIEELAKEVRKLRAELSYQKRKHERIEDALSRHIGTLDHTIKEMFEGVRLLGAELRPSERK